ncbi:membrane protein [Chryseobacterium formosense]|uniref:Membrane protein n=1 Tax=Chryseobacterium formosense TaxID=236814 RepID=A0A085ZA43_9FLAO|nr:type IV secretion system protein [Chryseobacterium formosense]KFF01307.1 membrane protein [Chryseobacterium formosense]SFT45423.1 TrbL/VirB6 plasmid conjugal transfer protein [Chryseobacterium formosense]
MNRKLTYFLCLLAIGLPVMGFAQTDSDYSNLLQFLKGDGAFEKWFMEVFTKLDNSVQDSAEGSALVGRAIGGLGALMYLGYMGWQMAAGDREWEIVPMLKPILIGFTLIYWTGFVNLIQAPFEAIAEPGIAIFSDIESEVNDLRIERFKKQQQLLDAVIKLNAEEDAKQEVINNTSKDTDDSWFDISDGIDKLLQPIKEWQIRMEFQLQKLVAEIIEFICLSILRICVYLIFFIQKIWAYILIILGPIAIGMALIPGFENSLYSWVSKFININLYTFVAYTIINIGQQLIASGYTMEIERYDTLLTNGTITNLDALMVYVSNSGMIYNQLFTCVAYIVTGVGVLMTPTIADTIVTAGGAGAMTKMKSAAGKMASSAKTAVLAAKTGGASAVAATTKAAAAGSASGRVNDAMKNGK